LGIGGSRVIATTIKQIIRLTNAKYGRLNAELYNQGNRKKKSISLTEKELKTIVQIR
jgi:hypothetical protein